MNWLMLVALTFTAYIIGSIPSGVIWGRLIKGVDVRQFGSGKTGATNSLRALGWQVSLLVFLSDALKGAICIALPYNFFNSAFHTADGSDFTPWAVLACGMASVIGHNISIFIGFKGGRGVANSIGQVAVVSPFSLIGLAILTFTVIPLTRYVSLASILGCILANLLVAYDSLVLKSFSPLYLVWTVCVTGYVFFSHFDNIKRLLNGTERKIGEKTAPAPPATTTPQPKEEEASHR